MKRWQCAVVVWALSTLAAPLPVAAAAETGPATKNATETIVAESDDIRALVAPVALYADPILALVLQAGEPFHGYYFRILTGQGANAAGGKYSYIPVWP